MSSDIPPIAVIIPCYNAADTLVQAVNSALVQLDVTTVWIVDDGSTDVSWRVAQAIQQAAPKQVRLLQMPVNSGAAMARNWAALHCEETILAFLDADDVYQPYALEAAALAFASLPQMGLVRLALEPWGYEGFALDTPEFKHAWRVYEMSAAGNMVVRRSLFLAAGGFPQDALFKRLGGEDGALGLALHTLTSTGTLFDRPGVRNRYHPKSHAIRLLKNILANQLAFEVSAQDLVQADGVTQQIVKRVRELGPVMDGADKLFPILVTSKT